MRQTQKKIYHLENSLWNLKNFLVEKTYQFKKNRNKYNNKKWLYELKINSKIDIHKAGFNWMMNDYLGTDTHT